MFKVNSRLKSQALQLRTQGASFRSISSQLHISISTAHNWTKHIPLSLEQIALLKKKSLEIMRAARKMTANKQKDARVNEEANIFLNAKETIRPISDTVFFYLGLALYWAEGFKKEYSMGFINSDPAMVKMFIFWLKKFGKVDDNCIHIRIQINRIYSNKITEIESKWSTLLQIPLSQFQKPYFQSSTNISYRPSYLGLARIRVVGGRKLFVKILGYIEGLKQLSFV